MNFNGEYKKRLMLINEHIESFFANECRNLESFVTEAPVYSVLNGGKRVRGILTLEVARMLGGNEKTALEFAAAIEFIQAYSLVHDDLPCMDDDDYRRGQLSCHKKFGEAKGVLCGDSLLNLAYEVMLKSILNGGDGEKKAAAEIKAKQTFGAQNFDEIAPALQRALRENGETLQTLSAQISAAEAKIKQKNTVETQIEAAEKNLRSYQDEIAKINVRVAGNNASLAENQKRVDELNGALQFASEEEARAATEAAEKKKKEIEAAVEAAEKARRESDTKIAGYQAAIETAKKNLADKTETDEEAETARRAALSAEKIQLDERKKAVAIRLGANETALKNICEKSGVVAETERKWRFVRNLSDTANGTLGGKEKVMLETYVQAHYFDRIVNRANVRFMVMSGGQYELKRSETAEDKKSQSGLDLNVVDHYNGSERSVKTLSGGEAFKASLSLALGLSDEIQSSAGGIRLDTMFVDEGFGSLDEESLAQAMKALSSLSEGERLVGIISHVSELKEKIDKQIVVTKMPSGGSKAEIRV